MRLCLWSLIAIVVSSCRFSGPDRISNVDLGSAPPEVEVIVNQACYPGALWDYSICLKKFETSEIALVDGNYDYRDPSPDKGFPESQKASQYLPPHSLVEITTENEDWSLVPNFLTLELMQTFKGIYGVFSIPTLEKIQNMRDELGHKIIITSGYRSPGYNASISGASQWSRHSYGDAIDFVADGVELMILKDLCLEYEASFTLVYESHIHCDWRNNPLDPNFYPEIQEPTHDQKIIPDPQISFQSNSEILFAVKNSLVNFKTIHPPGEDPGTLLHQWQITTPMGQIFETRQPDPSFDWAPGTWRANVTLGGTMILHKEFHL